MSGLRLKEPYEHVGVGGDVLVRVLGIIHFALRAMSHE